MSFLDFLVTIKVSYCKLITYLKTKLIAGHCPQFHTRCRYVNQWPIRELPIYPCNCHTGLSKVPLETYSSCKDFSVFHIYIKHFKLLEEQFDCREIKLICAAIVGQFGNLCEKCTFLTVPSFVPYNHYRGRKSNSEKYVKGSLNTVPTL